MVYLAFQGNVKQNIENKNVKISTCIALSGKEGTFLAGFLGMKTLISIQQITLL